MKTYNFLLYKIFLGHKQHDKANPNRLNAGINVEWKSVCCFVVKIFFFCFKQFFAIIKILTFCLYKLYQILD